MSPGTERPVTAPICLAMVLSDSVWKDPSTNKHTILGTFTGIVTERFPTEASLGVYFVLTDSQGTVPLTLRLLDDGDPSEEPLYLARAEMSFSHPQDTVEGYFPVPKLRFPRAGRYRFQLRCLNNILSERNFVVGTRGPSAESDEKTSR